MSLDPSVSRSATPGASEHEKHIVIYIETSPQDRQRFTVQGTQCIWPTISKLLQERELTDVDYPVYSLDLEVSGLAKYEDVVVDFESMAPEVEFKDIGAVHGCLIKISEVHPSTVWVNWPEPTSLAGPVEILDVPEHRVSVRGDDGFYHCDFEDCEFRAELWHTGMLPHFEEVHHTLGVFCCPHEACQSGYRSVGEYEEHVLVSHDGMRVPRRMLPTVETKRRIKITQNAKAKDLTPTSESSVKAVADSHLLKVQDEHGFYHCDFDGCTYESKKWSPTMTAHFVNTHGSEGGFYCPYYDCPRGQFWYVADYEAHFLVDHGGVRLPRYELTPEEIEEKISKKERYLKERSKRDIRSSRSKAVEEELDDAVCGDDDGLPLVRFHWKERKGYDCDFVGCQFTGKHWDEDMTPHFAEAHGTQGWFFCGYPDCEYASLSCEGYRNHIRRQHGNVYPERVSISPDEMKMRMKAEVPGHLKLRTPEEDGYIHCDFEGCNYKSKLWDAGVRNHFYNKHHIKGYTCPYKECGCCFPTADDYDQHTFKVHNGVRLPRKGLPLGEKLRQKRARANARAISRRKKRLLQFVPTAQASSPIPFTGTFGEPDAEGNYNCDFEGCTHKTKKWKGSMTGHFVAKHYTQGGYCCPYQGCEFFGHNVPLYELHVMKAHGGVFLRRREMSFADTQARIPSHSKRKIRAEKVLSGSEEESDEEMYLQDDESELSDLDVTEEEMESELSDLDEKDEQSFLPDEPLEVHTPEVLELPATTQHLPLRVKVRQGGFYHCDFLECEHQEAEWSNMLKHFRDHHLTRGGYRCSYPNCHQDSVTVSQYETHIKKCHNSIRLSRVQSDDRYDHRGLIKVMIDGYYYCDFEGCSFKCHNWENAMNRHFRDHHGASGYQCPHPKCHRSFTNVRFYEEHIRTDHDSVLLPRSRTLLIEAPPLSPSRSPSPEIVEVAVTETVAQKTFMPLTPVTPTPFRPYRNPRYASLTPSSKTRELLFALTAPPEVPEDAEDREGTSIS